MHDAADTMRAAPSSETAPGRWFPELPGRGYCVRMFGRLLRWLRGPSPPVATPVATPAATPGRTTESDSPYRQPAPEPLATRVTSPESRDWWAVPLMPAGVFERIEVFALQSITGMLHITTNDIVLVHEGMPHVFEHERCAPAGPEWWNFTTHVLRNSYESMQSHAKHRRLVTVPTYEAPHLPLSLEDREILTRPFEPAEPTGRRVDLAPALSPELARVLRVGDPDALSAALALLDLLARFDGHCRGEIYIASSPAGRRSNLRIGLGAAGVDLLGDRVDEATRARVAAALTPGITADGARVQALIDKRESLSSSSGYLARLCLATLEVSASGFVYEDELLWTEFDPGMEYS